MKVGSYCIGNHCFSTSFCTLTLQFSRVVPYFPMFFFTSFPIFLYVSSRSSNENISATTSQAVAGTWPITEFQKIGEAGTPVGAGGFPKWGSPSSDLDDKLTGAKRREWNGIIITSYYGSFPHSLLSTSK